MLKVGTRVQIISKEEMPHADWNIGDTGVILVDDGAFYKIRLDNPIGDGTTEVSLYKWRLKEMSPPGAFNIFRAPKRKLSP